MKKLLLPVLLALCVSCAPTYRLVTKKCPTFSMYLGDFGVTAAALLVATLKVSSEKYPEAAAYAAGGMGLALADNLSELSCRK